MGLLSFLRTPKIPREPTFDGLLYPSDADRLRELVDSSLGAADRSARAIVVPHSDLNLVAPVAAAGYRRLAPANRTVVIGPSHRVPFAGLAVPNADGWTTPLGTARIDTDAYDEITSPQMVRVMDAAFEAEPAVELQIPWVQTIQSESRLVPLLCGDARAEEVAEVLDSLITSDAVLVVACEFAWDRSEAEVNRIDQQTLAAISRGDSEDLGRRHVTGATPLKALIHLAQTHGWTFERLLHRTSKDLGGPGPEVAGYAALAFFDPA